VKDTAGQPFEITLSGGGAAKASRGEGMVGTWKEEGKTAGGRRRCGRRRNRRRHAACSGEGLVHRP
jgi:hypothetical protein